MLTNSAIEIRSLLEPRERLLWSGTPRPGLVLRRIDALYIPVSIFFAAFAIVWEILALTTNAPFFFPLFGIPFVLIGLYHLIGRFFFDAAKRKRTVYGLTERRAIVVSKLFTTSVTSVPVEAIPQLTLSHHRNGRGTITFGPEAALYRQLPFSRGGEEPTRFEQIEDPTGVHALIRDVMNQAQ